MLYTMHYDSPVGSLLLAEKDGALAGLWIEGQKYFLGSYKEEKTENRDSMVLKHTKEWLDRYWNLYTLRYDGASQGRKAIH